MFSDNVKYREVNYFEGDCSHCDSKNVEIFRVFLKYGSSLGIWLCADCQRDLRD